MVKFAIALGFRDVADPRGFRPYVSGESTRRTIHDWVMGEWRRLFPDVHTFEADSPDAAFNRSRARNDAVNWAFTHADTVLVVDADVVPLHGPVLAALREMERHPDLIQWATPYTSYMKATRRATANIMAGTPVHQVDDRLFGWRTHTGTAGLMLVTREAWETVGGYDETFTGWGWEDTAIVDALGVMVHGVTRTNGTCVHLEHSRSRTRLREKAAMEALFQPYYDNRGSREGMAALLRERGLIA